MGPLAGLIGFSILWSAWLALMIFRPAKWSAFVDWEHAILGRIGLHSERVKNLEKGLFIKLVVALTIILAVASIGSSWRTDGKKVQKRTGTRIVRATHVYTRDGPPLGQRRLSGIASMAAVFPRCGRFFAPAGRGFQSGGAPVRGVRCAGSSKSSGSRPRVSTGIRGLRDGEAVRAVSHQFQQGGFLF
jgi:hypothetical protein